MEGKHQQLIIILESSYQYDYDFVQKFNVKTLSIWRYHSAAAMRSAYNTGGVSSTGGVSDCAGLQSIGAAITSAATGKHS